jgi:hypothetical protein
MNRLVAWLGAPVGRFVRDVLKAPSRGPSLRSSRSSSMLRPEGDRCRRSYRRDRRRDRCRATRDRERVSPDDSGAALGPLEPKPLRR